MNSSLLTASRFPVGAVRHFPLQRPLPGVTKKCTGTIVACLVGEKQVIRWKPATENVLSLGGNLDNFPSNSQSRLLIKGPLWVYSVEKLEKLIRPYFRCIELSSKNLFKTHPGDDELVCAESLEILYIPWYQKE